MLFKMEGFITEVVCICTGSTKMTDMISQETPVSHYSPKQNDRWCNQSTEGQSPVPTTWYHNHETVPAYWKQWQPVQQLLWLLLYVTWVHVTTICEILCPHSGCDKDSSLLRCCAMLSGNKLLMFQRSTASPKTWISTVSCYHTIIHTSGH